MGQHYDVMVIGAGPGGYVAAIRAAKLGLHVAVVEEDRAGGTCLNRGCIPAKAMIHAAETYRSAREADQFGVESGRVSFDYGKILAYKEETTDALVQGVEQLLAGNGVDRLAGKGTLLAGKKVRVTTEEKEEVYAADHIILAAGSKPLLLPIPGMDLPGVLTSDGLFRLQECPESLAIIGGGVISVEFATAFAGFGTKVTILEALPRLVPNLDKEISQNLKMILKKRGVDIHTSASVQEVAEEDGRYVLRFTEKEQKREVSARYVLCAVGRVPNTEGLFAEDALPDMERGRVLVDEKFETSIPGVYAIGDLIFGMQLAHTASAQGTVVAEHLAGQRASVERAVVPSCGTTETECASVGQTEVDPKEQGIPVRVGKFIMSANGKSLISKEERGFVKILAAEESGVILGAQMMCARATDMIGELATAVANGLTAKQLLRGMRAHPTYNEGIGEALEELEGGAIHVMPRRKR